MLNFSKEFFLEETREDFTVDSTMKTFWAAQLEVLREISEVCERHGIQWYGAYGTLLGAMRHKGYVPWDDDMDIWMMREDYNRFLKVAPIELPQGFAVQSPLTDVGYSQFHTCIFNGLTISTSKERLERFHGCPFAAGIDVFPLDTLPDDPEERDAQEEMFCLIEACIELLKKPDEYAKEAKKRLGDDTFWEDEIGEEWKWNDEDEAEIQEGFDAIDEVCCTKVHRELHDAGQNDKLISELYKLQNELCSAYHAEDGKQIAMYMDYVNFKKIYEREDFDEVLMQPFEEFLIPVPSAYDKILHIIYGDWHKRVRNSACHDYPLYGKQMDLLRSFVDRINELDAKIERMILESRGQ